MPKKTTLAELLTQSSLLDHAGPVYYQRGVEYFENDAVELRRFDEQEISARVEGSETYRVVLRAARQQLDSTCSCPLGDEGEFCKHVVATGLAWLARTQRTDQGGGKPLKRSPSIKRSPHDSPEFAAIRQFVQRNDKKTLGALLLQQAVDDDAFAARVLSVSTRGGAVKPAAIKKAIHKALYVDDYVDYRAAHDVVDRAADSIELIHNVLEGGDAAGAAELAEYALRLGFEAIELVDDSDGGMGDVLEQIIEVHLLACTRGGVPVKQLARSVFDLQFDDPVGVIGLEPYLKVLGADGQAAYRKLARDYWQKLPPPPADKLEDKLGSARYHITDIMKTLARIDNDVNAMVEILKRDLRHAHDYLIIAQTLAQAKRHDEALQWAEDGRKKFGDMHQATFDDFLAAEYHRRKRHDEAIALQWARFQKRPDLQTYQLLKVSADKNHTWTVWREKALAHVHAITRKNAQTRAEWMYAGGATLIDIHLWEGNPSAALEAAREYTCPDSYWLTLAKALEADNPVESIRIYTAKIEPVIVRGSPDYREACQLIKRLRSLMHGAKREREFATWLAGVRLRYKAKRNFIKGLDAMVEKN